MLEIVTKGYLDMWWPAYKNTINCTKLNPIWARLIYICLIYHSLRSVTWSLAFVIAYEVFLARYLIKRAFFHRLVE